MRQFFKDLLEGKYAIGYTLTKVADMVPREIRWLNRLPVLGFLFQVGQFFWFITKIIFFVTIISWFKPQYQQRGAKVPFFFFSFALIFTAWWMMKTEFYTKRD